MNYPVNNIYPCIQGEGCLTGVPMVMLRLQGCEVGCPFCDTKETWELLFNFEMGTIKEALGQTPSYTVKGQTEITGYIVTNYPLFKWVLVSGGEPAKYNLKPLVTALHDAGYKVAVETSGTEVGHIGAGFDWVCVSPKIGMPGGKVVNPQAVEITNEIKYTVGKASDIKKLDNLLSIININKDVQICLQPISQNNRATQLCIKTVQERGWRLSVQVHKYLALP